MFLKLLRFYGSEIQGPKATIVFAALLVAGSNALLIATINDVLEQRLSGAFDPSSIVVFFASLACLLGGGYFLIFKTTHAVGGMMHGLRVRIAGKVAECGTRALEEYEVSRLYANITHDIDRLGSGALQLVGVAQAAALVVFCLSYIAWLSAVAFLLVLLAAGGAVALFFINHRKAHRYVEEIGESETAFFGALSDLIFGFKEAKLHDPRRKALTEHLGLLSRDRKENYAISELLFYRANFLSQGAIFTIMAGMIFVPEGLFGSVSVTQYQVVTAVLFATAPLIQILDYVGPAVRAMVSLRKLNDLEKALDNETLAVLAPLEDVAESFTELTLKGVEVRYGADDDAFVMGPLDLTVRAGDTLFIMGGNGSGKTTLLKVICGLYSPEIGSVSVNGRLLDKGGERRLRHLVSAIFYDFHLFQRLYGLTDAALEKGGQVLDLLELTEKTRVEQDRFSSINLSAGQRKRLALAVSMLEERPIMVFDEFAADQDPVFREKFYREILPLLKQAGKTVIAITHDEAYQDCCDTLIRMDKGLIAERLDRRKIPEAVQ